MDPVYLDNGVSLPLWSDVEGRNVSNEECFQIDWCTRVLKLSCEATDGTNWCNRNVTGRNGEVTEPELEAVLDITRGTPQIIYEGDYIFSNFRDENQVEVNLRGYSYAITGISPLRGPVTGGQLITLNGIFGTRNHRE